MQQDDLLHRFFQPSQCLFMRHIDPPCCCGCGKIVQALTRTSMPEPVRNRRQQSCLPSPSLTTTLPILPTRGCRRCRHHRLLRLLTRPYEQHQAFLHEVAQPLNDGLSSIPDLRQAAKDVTHIARRERNSRSAGGRRCRKEERVERAGGRVGGGGVGMVVGGEEEGWEENGD